MSFSREAMIMGWVLAATFILLSIWLSMVMVTIASAPAYPTGAVQPLPFALTRQLGGKHAH
ncbi:MAG: hypothetical protein GXO56_05850 [Chloroflexi bacterium]|nr:hypothetical protein [Chloroflexota bacterium]